MIKVTVLYPNRQGAKFDMDYYCGRHIPMVREKLGTACKGISVEQGMAGMPPGAPAPFIALAHVYFDTVESFQAAFAPHAAEIMADLPNYTDIEPTIQISDVKI